MDGAAPAHERPRRRVVEWAVVGGVALAALVLGYVGFADADKGGRLGWSDYLYRSVQLFVLESGGVSTPPPASLEIARVLAPLVAAYAAIRALVLLFRDQVALLGLRVRRRPHVVVGVGRKGFALVKALRAAGERVVAIERDPAAPALAGCRERDVPVLIGDAADERLLARARVPRARALVVTAGDDRTNVDVAFAAAGLPFRRTAPLSAFVHLDDLGLWRLLQPQVLALRDRLPFRIEFFNVEEEAARLLLDEHPPFDGTGSPHVLVVGPGGLAESVVVQAARMWPAAANGRGPLRITLAGEDAAGQRDELLARHPGLSGRCSIDAWELRPAGEGPPGPPVTAAYVCLPGRPAGLGAALALSTHPATGHVTTVLAVPEDRSGIASALHGRRLRVFGVLSRTLTADLLAHGTNEALAQAKHEHYVEQERARGLSATDNPSIVPWSQLDDSLKESNRLFADSVSAKLDAAGCTVVPAPLADPGAPGFAFSDAEVEELARGEHDRWCRDLLRHGWRPGPVKDPQRRVHPKLVPWSELSEDDRDRDREPVRALPEMLALVGFEIRRSADGGRPV